MGDGVTRRTFLGFGLAASASAFASVNSNRELRVRDVRLGGETGQGLEAGVAVREITPEPGQQMWGYSNPEQIAQGVRDPLYAKSLVLKVGDGAIGVVALDLGRMPLPETCQRIRERVAALGIKDVILTATHTHSGPYMEFDGLPHLQPVEDSIVETLQEAAGNAAPAAMGFARTRIDISHNRRFIKDGVCYMKWRNESREPTSPIDHEAGVLQFQNAETGAAIATLVNFACHPVIFGPDNRRYSADWPGEMYKVVEAGTGGVCMYLQGGAGDINPYLDKTPIADGADAAVRSEGRKAGEAVLRAVRGMTIDPSMAPSLHYREQPVEVGVRWDLEDSSQVELLRENYDVMYEKYMDDLPPDFAVPLGVLLVNESVALVFMPGEMFVDFQLDLKKRSPLRDTFLCGYAQEFHVYFPTVRDITYGGYGAATVTYVGVGAGEKLVTRATAMIGEMTGGIGPLRGAEDFEIREL